MIEGSSGKYQGETQNGKPHGRGKYISWFLAKGSCKWSENKSYKGGWKEGKRYGQGVYYYGDKELKRLIEYKGEWENDLYHGFGILSERDNEGDKLERKGIFSNGEIVKKKK